MSLREELERERKKIEREIIQFIKEQNGATTYAVWKHLHGKGMVRGFSTTINYLQRLSAEGKLKKRLKRQSLVKTAYVWEVV